MFKIINYLLIFGCAGLCCCPRLSLVAASGECSPVVVCGLLIAEPSLVTEHWL